MATMMIQQFPATKEQYEQVNDKLGLDKNIPDGLLIHTGEVVGDEIRIVDVWESQGAFEAFLNGPLGAAVVEVMGPPPDDAQGPNIEYRELANVIQP